jgi:hypothetical protein
VELSTARALSLVVVDPRERSWLLAAAPVEVLKVKTASPLVPRAAKM